MGPMCELSIWPSGCSEPAAISPGQPHAGHLCCVLDSPSTEHVAGPRAGGSSEEAILPISIPALFSPPTVKAQDCACKI